MRWRKCLQKNKGRVKYSKLAKGKRSQRSGMGEVTKLADEKTLQKLLHLCQQMTRICLIHKIKIQSLGGT